MQDEVTKHTRKIYKTLKSPLHSVGEKVKETFIEVCIIVFAVTLSIWLHSWSEHRHEQREVKDFLKGLTIDLNKDIKLLEHNRSLITKVNSNFEFLIALKDDGPSSSNIDADISNHWSFAEPVSHLNIGRYDGFKSSGKIGSIEDDDLKENILVFYQQTLPGLGYSESYINGLQNRILDLQIDSDNKTSGKELIMSKKMRSLLYLGINNAGNTINDYSEAITQAKKIIAEINKYDDY